jgi:alkylation response protein AidB-like acyl-CoA dehydrogenase
MELNLLRESVADVLRDECALERVQQHVRGAADLDAPLRKLAGDLGWVAAALSEDDGGLGFGLPALVVLGEELGRTLAPGSLGALLVAAKLLAEHAPAPLRERYLDRALAGDLKVALGASLGETVRSGTEPLALGSADADLLLISHDGDLGLAELHGADGVLESRPSWDETRPLSAIRLHGAQVHRLGAEANARAAQMSRLVIAADCLGLADGVIARTIEFLGFREQFGQKLGSFQALKHRIADLFVDLQLKRALTDVAADDSPGLPVGFWAGAAKAEASDSAVFAARECIQFHGAIGYTWEHYCHLFMKRARLNQMLFGDNDALRRSAAAKLSDGMKAKAEFFDALG